MAPSDHRRQDLLEVSETQKELVFSTESGLPPMGFLWAFDTFKCAPARRLSSQMHFGVAEIRFRSTLVNPNAFLTLSSALALGACQAKCFSGMLKCALAWRPSIQMRLRSADMRSRSTLDDPNAFPIRSNALSLDACRSKCSRTNVANGHQASLEDFQNRPILI